MGLELLAKPAQVISRPPARQVLRRSLLPLVLCCYIGIAYWLTWRLWADPALRVPELGHGISSDIYLNVWFMRYAETAVAHGHLPALVTTALNAPQGINAMWNTSFLLPGVVLAPLTAAAGPQVSLTLALTLGFAGSAASLFLVLRNWGASIGAAALGGAVYGFSPALRVAATDHYHLQFAVLLPVIVHFALRLAVGRGHPLRNGVWLGVLISAQVFIAEEMLVASALASALGVLVLILSRPRAVPARLFGAACGFGMAAGVTLLLSGYALWVQLHGPLTEHGTPWNTQSYVGILQDFVVAPGTQLIHGSGFLQFLTRTAQRPSEYFAYLGWPLLGVVAAAAIGLWRDLRIRVAAVIFAGLELCSLGRHRISVGGWHPPVDLLPWHWLDGLPLLSEALPDRLSILADAAAAAVLIFALDRIRRALPAWRRRWRLPAAATVTALALVPLIPLIPLPVAARDIGALPAGWNSFITRLHLPQNARLLVLPDNDVGTMTWEANSAKPFSIIGGYCIAPQPDGQAAGCELVQNPFEQQVLQDAHQLAVGVPWEHAPDRAVMSTALADWKPTAVIGYVNPTSTLGRYLISYFGTPTAQGTNLLGWRLKPNS